MRASERIATAIFTARGNGLSPRLLSLNEEDMREVLKEFRDAAPALVAEPTYRTYMGVKFEAADGASELTAIPSRKIGRYEIPPITRLPI